MMHEHVLDPEFYGDEHDIERSHLHLNPRTHDLHPTAAHHTIRHHVHHDDFYLTGLSGPPHHETTVQREHFVTQVPDYHPPLTTGYSYSQPSYVATTHEVVEPTHDYVVYDRPFDHHSHPVAHHEPVYAAPVHEPALVQHETYTTTPVVHHE